jgi:ABC-type glycerol-3-phosphate transport system substrate-binding protein
LRKRLPLLALFCAILQGCAPLPLVNGETLYVMVVTQRRMDWLKRNETHDRLWAPLLKEYQRLHPNVRVSFYTVREEDLHDQLRQRLGRGLGPDLLLTRGAMANTLLREGLIAPVPQTPGMARSLAEIRPEDLRRVRNGTELAGVPVSDVVTLACYDRKTLTTPPRTTEELMATAAAGHIIGLSLDAFGIPGGGGRSCADLAGGGGVHPWQRSAGAENHRGLAGLAPSAGRAEPGGSGLGA